MFYKVKDGSEFLRNLHSTNDYELYELEFLKVAVDQQESQAIVLMSANNKIVGFDLNSLEGTIYTFVKSGCSENSHIKNIYNLYVETMNIVKFNLTKAIIESVSGDMIYARIYWQDHKDRLISQLCSSGDAIVLAEICSIPLYVTKKALDLLDDYSNFHEEFHEYEE